jgi:hypothetical protein
MAILGSGISAPSSQAHVLFGQCTMATYTTRMDPSGESIIQHLLSFSELGILTNLKIIQDKSILFLFVERPSPRDDYHQGFHNAS